MSISDLVANYGPGTPDEGNNSEEDILKKEVIHCLDSIPDDWQITLYRDKAFTEYIKDKAFNEYPDPQGDKEHEYDEIVIFLNKQEQKIAGFNNPELMNRVNEKFFKHIKGALLDAVVTFPNMQTVFSYAADIVKALKSMQEQLKQNRDLVIKEKESIALFFVQRFTDVPEGLKTFAQNLYNQELQQDTAFIGIIENKINIVIDLLDKIIKVRSREI